VIEALAAAHQIGLRRELPKAQYGEGTIGGQRVVLGKPLTYMNESGRGVAALAARFSLSPSDLILIHDDLDLALGRIKVKTQGGDAGHHGVRSVIEHLGRGDFTRIRVGIGRPASKAEIVPYVLNPFLPDELPQVEEAVRNAVKSVEDLLG
jgi:PTH1 family peptidyl-tRNA hydrolase